ncbi:MAG: tetratricopeptide repeat protein [Gemmatimonadota bacterium]|nr:tetratricopeptide repeat protein [Gemmatimonadota bacterium]
MKKLLTEIHRRSIWQVLGVYLAGSWIALQVVDTLNSTIGLPDWFPGAAFGLLAIGLPIVLSTAIVQGGVVGSAAETAVGPGSVTKDDEADRTAVSTEAPTAGPQGAPPRTAPSAGTPLRGFLTWRRAALGGLGAFALLGVVTAGYFISRATGIGPAGTLVAQGLLEERPRILLTQFSSPTGDSTLARTATEALRSDLAESPVVTLAEPVFVRDALQRMQRPPSSPLGLDLGRELGRREGIGALVAGELSAVGDGYAISGQVIDVETGAALVSHRVSADDANDLLPAIDKLSKKLRERIGESLRTIRADPPRERVTTGSFEAFQSYSLAIYAEEVEGESEKARLLYEEAIRADSTFGMAYLKLGELSHDRSVEVAMTDRAYAMRDGMSDRERFYTIASYHWLRGEWDRAVAALESLLAEHPGDGSTLTWVSGLYMRQGDLERAEETARRAVAAPTCGFCSFQALARAQVALGRFDDASATAEQAVERLPTHPGSSWLLAVAAAARRDYPAATAIADSVAAARPEMAANSLDWMDLAAAIEGIHGRLRRADGRVVDYLRAQQDVDTGDHFWLMSVRAGQALVRGDSVRALSVIREAEADRPLDTLDPLDRPYVDLAYAYASAGDAASARRLLDEWQSTVPDEFRSFEASRARESEASAHIAERDFDAALEALRGLPRVECWGCLLEARANDLAGRVDEAIAGYERYVETPSLFDVYESQFFLASAHERLALLYDERGDAQDAARHYAAFVELWAEADSELQPRVRAADERLQTLLRQIG